MRDARLACFLGHHDLTLEVWGNVVWADGTSVVLHHRRGECRISLCKIQSLLEFESLLYIEKSSPLFMLFAGFTYNKNHI